MSIPLLNFYPLDESNPGLEVIDLNSIYQRASTLDHDPSRPHRLKFFHLIYITDGTGSHSIDFKNYSYRSGSFIFINKRQVHAFDFKNYPEGKAILFTQEFLDSTNIQVRMPFFTSILMNLNSPILTVKGLLKDSCEAIIKEIDRELNCNDSSSSIIQFLFSTLLLKLDRERPSFYFDNALTDKQALKFTQFMALVEENFVTLRDAAAYAQMLAMTYKSLNQICKLACNQTPKQLIDAHTILEAKRRLVIEKTQVSQLAYELEFEEVSNFVKYFKNHTLLTPAQFKSNHSG